VRRPLAGAVLAVALLAGGAAPAQAAHRDRCRYEDCGDRYGDGGSGGGQGASGGDYEGGHGGDTDQRGDHNCRNFCFYGIPAPPMPGQQPKGFIPPDPRKIPQQVADFVKLVADFVQSVIKFAV
jgi:hypothetical protein